MENIFFAQTKKLYPLSFPILGGLNSTRTLQSSLLQKSGGYPERDGGGEGRTKEILVSNIGYLEAVLGNGLYKLIILNCVKFTNNTKPRQPKTFDIFESRQIL